MTEGGGSRRAALVALALAACSSPPRGIVLWHAYNGTERSALEATAAEWNAAHAELPLTLVAVPYDAFADKLSSAIPRGNGPDLFIYPQDRIGDWADAGAIEPLEFWVDDALADHFTRRSLAAMAYKGSLYGLPVAEKSLALFYRTDLIAQPPRTTDELIALGAKQHVHGDFAIAYPDVDLFGHAVWLHGFGGRVLDGKGDPTIATPEAEAAMRFARDLAQTGAAPLDAQPPLIASLFNEGHTATAMSGPWFFADLAPGVPWAVTTLPIVSATGKPAEPFSGAEGILISARATNKTGAFAVAEFLTSDAEAIERAKLARQVVPNVHAYDDPAVAADPALEVFRAQLEGAVAMPKDTAMRVTWIPYRTALGEVLSGRKEPRDQLEHVESEVKGYAQR